MPRTTAPRWPCSASQWRYEINRLRGVGQTWFASVGQTRLWADQRWHASTWIIADVAGSLVTVALIALASLVGRTCLPGTYDKSFCPGAPHIMAPYVRPACPTRGERGRLTGVEWHALDAVVLSAVPGSRHYRQRARLGIGALRRRCRSPTATPPAAPPFPGHPRDTGPWVATAGFGGFLGGYYLLSVESLVWGKVVVMGSLVGSEWLVLLMLLIFAAVLGGGLWLLIRSAVRAGVRQDPTGRRDSAVS